MSLHGQNQLHGLLSMIECVIEEEKYFSSANSNGMENDIQIKEIMNLLLTKHELGLRLIYMIV